MIPGSVNPLLAGAREYSIPYSMRFRQGSSFLTRTLSTSGNPDKWTWSAWIKRGRITDPTAHMLIAATIPGTTYYQSAFNINSSDQLWYYQFTNSTGYTVNVTSTAVFRDPSAWYHIVLKYDRVGSNMVAWVNNQEAINTSSYSTSLQYINVSGVAQYYGNYTYQSDPGGVFDGHMADLHFIDNQALTPSSFAETDPTTGVWRPKKYTGTYTGTSHRLEFANSSNFGVDTSGNANNWTQSAGVASTDQMTDTPTLNYASLNSVDSGPNIFTANGNLQLKNSSGGSFERIRSSFGMITGKWYAEFVINSEGNPSRIQAGLMSGSAGITTSFLGNGDALSWSIYESAGSLYKVTNSTATLYVSGGSLDPGQIHMLAYDADAGKFWYGKNGTFFASGDPASGTNEMFSGVSVSGENIFFASSAYDTSDSGTWNFGQRPFVYTPPTGFKALNSRNLPTPSIKKGSTYFDTVTYTGNGTSQNLTNLSFQSDLIWIKRRDSSTNGDHLIVDTSRTSELTQSNTFVSNTITNWVGDTANWTFGYIDGDGLRGGRSGVNARTNMYLDLDIDANTAFEIEYKIRGTDPLTSANAAGGVAIYRKQDQGNVGVTAGTNYYALGMFSSSSTHWVNSVDPANTVGVCVMHSAASADVVEEKGANTVTLTSNVASSNVFFLSRESDGNLKVYRTNSTGDRILLKTHPEKTNSIMRLAVTGTAEGNFLNLEYVKINLIGASSTTTRYPTLYTNLTTTEFIEDEFISFNNNGFSIASSNGNTIGPTGKRVTRYNINAATYASYAWKKTPSAGFDIVTYGGTGSAQTLSHNLGVAPSMMIVKNRTGLDRRWTVYHKSIPNSETGGVYLDLINAWNSDSTLFNSTAPTSSQFTVGSYYSVTGETYVTYLWSEVANFSKFGSYLGNGGTSGPFVWCGFRPKWVMIKAYNLGTYFMIWSSYNNNEVVSRLIPTLTNSEASNVYGIDILSNGFKVRAPTGYSLNNTGYTYIFAAFAETPFKYARAR